MLSWIRAFGVLLGLGFVAAGPVGAQDTQPTGQRPPPVVAIKPDRIILLDITRAGERLLAVGERGIVLQSDDQGRNWTAIPTPVTRTLTGVAFKDAQTGIAVGHGASVVRTDDGGATWAQVPLEEAGTDSLLGVSHLGGDHFVAYGAFGLYFDSTDAGRTWQRRTILSEEFDRHISKVLPVGNSLLLVAETGVIARSDDGGSTWTQLESPYEGSYFGALVVNDGSILIFGMRGNVYRTVELGTAWRKIDTGTTASLMFGRQLEDGRVLLVGNAGLLAISANGGQSLVLRWSPAGRGFAALAESDGRTLLVGESGVTTLDPAWLAGR